jgi:hypothetical protein
MPRVNNKLPLSLATAIEAAVTPYEGGLFSADYAIGNQPWLSAVSDRYELNRVTTAYQRERVDQESSAGENSLSNWWLRSATNWNFGQGINFYDADPDDIYRFNVSWNVDVWTEGQVSLLPTTTNVYEDEVTFLTNAQGGVWFIADGGIVHWFDGTTASHYTTVATHGTAQCLTTDGVDAIVGTTKGIYRVTPAGTVTHLYSAVQTNGTWTAQQIAIVKERIIIGVVYNGVRYVFELAQQPASPPATFSVANAIFESSNTSLTFNSITETGASVLVAYTIGQVSRVVAFTIDQTSVNAFGLPSLSAAITVAKLPTGETINSIREYLNTYIIIATNKGLRVGIDTGGVGFSYGPLTITSEVLDIGFFGEYVYATRSVDLARDESTSKGLWRIDLGKTVGNTYAYASDLTVGSGTPTGVTTLGTTGRLIIGTTTGLWLESDDTLCDEGYIKSGKIRYGTNELKQPVSLNLTMSGKGSYDVEFDTNSGQHSEYLFLTPNGTIDLNLSAEVLPDEFFEITLTLKKSALDESPVLDQWVLRSLPAPARSRTITIPLLCFDEEKDTFGQIKVDPAFNRLKTLERLENAGAVVLLQDFTTGENRYCVIRAVQFVQSSPPYVAKGFGGIVTVQLQTIDSEL